MKTSIRIALAQINCTVGNLGHNIDKMAEFYEMAAAKESDIVVFPELSLCGYPPEDLLYSKKFISDSRNMLNNFAKNVGNTAALAGLPYRSAAGKLHNGAAVLQKGMVQALYSKMLLPNYSVFDEKRYFSSGDSVHIVEFGKIRIGLTICEDLWHSDGPANTLLANGVDIIVNLSASPYYRSKVNERERLFSGLCRGGGISLAYCNLVGGQDELVFDGGSFIINPDGRTIARGAQFKEELVVADIKIEGNKKKETDCGVKQYPAKKTVIRSNITPKVVEVKPSLAPVLESSAEMYEAIVLAVKDYTRKNGFSSAILGVSGGIDSALVAAIACDALGRENVVGISMPTVYSSSGTRSDARLLCYNLGMKFREISIQPLFEAFKKTLQPDFHGLAENLAEENLQARLRGNILMAYSNKFNHLLLSTGNKSEVSVGYSTLYGDMAGGYSPIKDLTKKMVYELSRYYNKKSGFDAIPVSIIERPPSAELRPDQKDSDSLPEYPVLDAILELHIEKHCDADTIIKAGYDTTIVKDVLRKVRFSEYKRRQAAPGVKITTLSFGKDRRMPITNGFSG